MDTPIATETALALVAKALARPETGVAEAGVMLLELVTGERKEIRFAPMRLRPVIARALAEDPAQRFADRAAMRAAITALRRRPASRSMANMLEQVSLVPRRLPAARGLAGTLAVIALVLVMVPLAVAYWDCLAR